MNKEDAHCVLLADRHYRLMEGVRGLLETEFAVVVMVSDEVSLLESASRLLVALAIVDLSLMRGDGIGLVRRLRARCPEMKMIVISVLDEPIVSETVLDAGANGFVIKRAIATDLLAAVHAVLAGGRYVSSGTGGRSSSEGMQ